MTELPKTRPFEPPEPRQHPAAALRLLPWPGPEGRPATLHGNGGYVSRLADEIEDLQLSSARAVFDLARVVLDNSAADAQEIRFAARRLHESLGDVLRLTEVHRHAHGTVPARKVTSPYVRRWTYDARCVSQARHELHHVLGAWGLDDLADRAELVLSELLTNALRHTVPTPDSEIETRYELLPTGVRIEVHDADDTRPTVQSPSTDEEAGRGLALVDALTGARWGVSDRAGVGKLLWAVLEVDGEEASEAET
nr:ATP-binding protein [Streptomyces sp. NBC_00899]